MPSLTFNSNLSALVLAASAMTSAQAAPAKPQPNIVYILADDMGYGDLVCNNPQSKIATPFMDSLARDGMRFTDAHSSSAVCTPSRYSIMTGRYSWRTSLKSGVLSGFSKPLIEAVRPTVASMLKGDGYATACIGKWHLGLGWVPLKADTPESGLNGRTIDFTKPVTTGPSTFGFDYSYVLPASLDLPPYVYLENGQTTETPLVPIAGSEEPAFYRPGMASPGFKHQFTLLNFTQKATKYIDDQSKTPGKLFFLYLALPSPHTPHMPRPEFAGKSKAGVYGDLVQEVDWSVGQVLEALKRDGVEQNTIVMLASDNGSFATPMKLDTLYGHLTNGDWRGQKSDVWDGGHRIPFLVRWPGKVKAGSVCNQTVGLTDLMATCAAITATPLTANEAEDSVSLLPLLDGSSDKPVHEAIVHHSNNGKFAIRDGKWKLILARGSGGWSLPEDKVPADAPDGQLYDMQADPEEKINLYNERPETVKQLSDLLHKYQDDGRSTPLPAN